MYYEYGQKEIAHLKKHDKLLGEAIDRIGHIRREVDSDLFASVVHHIVAQQISSQALSTVWSRLVRLVGNVNPQSINSCGRNDLQKCGMTFRKADYIKEFAEKVQGKEFDLNKLIAMSDEDVVKRLCSLKGIGPWTAEMIMIFSMQRPDIVSYGDLAIHRGMRMLYGHKEISKKLFVKYAGRYSPYGTVASLYLWAVSGETVKK